MAFTSGVATNGLDLYNKLRDFLVTGMTPIDQRWEQVAGNVGVLTETDQIILKGPGLAGTDEVLVSIDSYFSEAGDYHNLGFNGLTAYNPALGDALAQANRSGTRVLHLWPEPIDYWIVADGRRFIVVAKISTIYVTAYCGLVLPLSLPSMYPYPVFIGANTQRTTTRWSLANFAMRNFFDPSEESAALLFPDVLWRSVYNWTDSPTDDGTANLNGASMSPWGMDAQPLRENLDGGYSLQPAIVACSSPYAAQLARLPGVYRVSGFSNSAGSIVSVGGVDHLVIPNVYRSSWQHFAAIALQ